MKRYTYHDNNVVAVENKSGERLLDTFFHFCYHWREKNYIRIESPMRLETDPSTS